MSDTVIHTMQEVITDVCGCKTPYICDHLLHGVDNCVNQCSNKQILLTVICIHLWLLNVLPQLGKIQVMLLLTLSQTRNHFLQCVKGNQFIAIPKSETALQFCMKKEFQFSLNWIVDKCGQPRIIVLRIGKYWAKIFDFLILY